MHDDWGIDVLVTASQKAWGAPPGMAMVTMSERAWKAYERSDLPKLYFDLQSYTSSLENGATPATPACTVFIGLQESLRLRSDGGREARGRTRGPSGPRPGNARGPARGGPTRAAARRKPRDPPRRRHRGPAGLGGPGVAPRTLRRPHPERIGAARGARERGRAPR